MATYEQVTYNSPDGALIGNSATEKIGFYGTTPVVQPASDSQAAVTGTALGTIDFTSATEAATVVAQVNAITVLINQLRSDLVDLGVVNGEA